MRKNIKLQRTFKQANILFLTFNNCNVPRLIFTLEWF